MIESVTLMLPCPACGRDATWCGTPSALGTAYRIDCPPCEGWTVRAQLQRALTRRDSGQPHPHTMRS